MSVTKSSSAGNNLSDAIDIVNTSLSTKATYTYASSAPSNPNTGQIWMDISSGSPIGKVWNGSAWANFSLASADFSNTATGTYSSGGMNYKYVRFTGSSSVTISRAGLVDFLIVAGGGAGGGYNGTWGPGGGAGGMFELYNYYVATGTYTVTIGSGGTWGNRAPDSSVFGLVATGGGAGSYYSGYPFVGGSGGGGTGTGAASTVGAGGGTFQGNFGGNGGSGTSGGGGGAGGNGSSGLASYGGGGAGRASSITGTSVTYAAGGNVGANGSPVTGSANTGTGGTGFTGDGGSNFFGNSGVVIVRVRVS